jgi:thiol-disulfide isomerase/thioredoxin
MKKLYLIIAVLLFPTTAFLQTVVDNNAPYLKTKEIPSFKIFQSTDSTLFTKDNLPANKSIILIYFNTECGHCQYEANQIAHKMDSLQNAFFVWIDYHHTVTEIASFANKYKLDQFNNVVLGKESGFVIIPFYRIELTPYIAIYNVQHKFVKDFRKGEASITDLAQAIVE